MIALLLTLCLQAQAAPEAVFSGPQPDEGTPNFKVLALTGPDAGQQVDYVERFGDMPALYLFMHEVTRPTGRLVKLLVDYAYERNGRLNTVLVTLNDDVLEGELAMPRTLKSLDVQLPSGVSVDGKEGPGAWGLNREVAITAVLARNGRVVANWALMSPNETDFAGIRERIEQELVPRLETLEDLRIELLLQQRQIAALQREVASLQAKLESSGPRAPGSGRAARAADEGAMSRSKGSAEDAMNDSGKGGKSGMGGMGRADRGAGRGADRAVPEDELNQMIRPLAEVTATSEEIEQAIQAVDAFLAEDPSRQGRVVRAMQQLENRGRGNEIARKARAKYLEGAAPPSDSGRAPKRSPKDGNGDRN